MTCHAARCTALAIGFALVGDDAVPVCELHARIHERDGGEVLDCGQEFGPPVPCYPFCGVCRQSMYECMCVPDVDCVTLPNGECVADRCRLHDPR